MKLSLLSTVSALVALVAASPTPTTTLEKRADFCGQWDSVQTGSYILYNNLWGQSSGSGSQCTGVDSLSGSTIAWHTKWSWSGGQYNVKSFANANLKFTPLALSAIKSIPFTWKWGYTGSGIVANVAFDLFTSSTASGSPENEIMIWLGAIGGAGPISSTGSPVATVTLAGTSWNLYEGYNSQMKVFSFVRAGSDVTNFSADVNVFVSYVRSNRGLSSSQILQTVQGGTEPFVGSNAVFTTSAFSVALTQ